MHFMWIKWTINGDVIIVDSPDPEYHGKDYWKIEPLENDSMRSDLNRYLETYDSVLKQYNINPIKPSEKSFAPYETEYKFLLKLNQEEAFATFNLISESFGNEITGFRISDYDKRHRSQVDLYFDDENFSLYKIGASFRIRKKNTIRVTFK